MSSKYKKHFLIVLLLLFASVSISGAFANQPVSQREAQSILETICSAAFGPEVDVWQSVAAQPKQYETFADFVLATGTFPRMLRYAS